MTSQEIATLLYEQRYSLGRAARRASMVKRAKTLKRGQLPPITEDDIAAAIRPASAYTRAAMLKRDVSARLTQADAGEEQNPSDSALAF